MTTFLSMSWSPVKSVISLRKNILQKQGCKCMRNYMELKYVITV